VKKAFSAVLLAGGASARMGYPKALLSLGGVPLWRRQVDLLAGLGPAELLVSAGLDWDPGAGPWAVVRDRVPGLGPLGGIGAALGAMSTDLLLVLAIDMPSMTAGFLGSLVAAAGPAGVVPADGGLYQGLAAVYPRSVGATLEEALGGEDRSLQHFIGRALQRGLVAARPVAEAERPLFANVNRPSDL
jgi:molybdopterin-guanine dinucleotide biosynthesis protein A